MNVFPGALLALVMVSFVGTTRLSSASPPPSPAPPALTLKGVEYVYRWSRNDRHTFTPRGQEDLQRWTDMLTLTSYPTVKDGTSLAKTANTVLNIYKQNEAIVVKTASVPPTAEMPAEHLIVVLIPQKDLVEAVFARFKLVDGSGNSSVYSHRIYGKKNGPEIDAWLKQFGPDTERAILSMDLPVNRPAAQK